MWHLIFTVFNICLLQIVFTEDIEKFRSSPYVSIDSGIIKGHLVEDGNFSYMAFLGIPYARPPVGENRFKAPLPVVPWSGVLEANRTVTCMQGGTGDEDCLIVNVFTPNGAHQQLLPVLVDIPGGAYIGGAGSTIGAEFLLKRDIIVVTLNYRLGAFGFLCLGTEEAPGNAGMKDQVAALQWVKRNIIKFGGNPEEVTVYGTSAGGASVDLQVLSQMSDGLFRSAIAESGAAPATWPITIDPIASATKLAVLLNYFPKNLEDLAQFYKTVSAEELSLANAEYMFNLTDGTVGFSPCIEATLPHTTKFMSESPYDILQHGNYEKVPMMMILSSLEALFLRSPHYSEQNYKERLESNFEDFLPADLIFETDEQRKNVAQEIKRFYFGDKPVDDDMIVQYLEYFSDSIISHGILESAELHSKHTPVYLMEFSYRGNMRNYERLFDNITVAGHSGLYRFIFAGSSTTQASDLEPVEKVADLVANFIKFGNPTPRPSPRLPFTWPRISDPHKMEYLLFAEDLKVLEKPQWRRKQFWDYVYNVYRRPLTPVKPY